MGIKTALHAELREGDGSSSEVPVNAEIYLLIKCESSFHPLSIRWRAKFIWVTFYSYCCSVDFEWD